MESSNDDGDVGECTSSSVAWSLLDGEGLACALGTRAMNDERSSSCGPS